tara:strand:- start:1666 stop:2814 length:1149 start_codon:yes stop_codon:yes gene_type:complete
MKEIIFFTNRFGDLDHIRNLIFHLSKKKIKIHILQNQLNHSISLSDFEYNKISKYLRFYPRNLFKIYNFIHYLRLKNKSKIFNFLSWYLLQFIRKVFFYNKKKFFLNILKKNSSVIFCGSIDEDIIQLKDLFKFKTCFLLHGLKTHKGFKDKNFQKILEIKKTQKNLDRLIACNLNQWKTGGLKNKPIFLANPRYGMPKKIFKNNLKKKKYETLVILDKIKWNYGEKTFYAFKIKELIKILDFLLSYCNKKIVFKFHPSLDINYFNKFIDFKKFNNCEVFINERKTEELIFLSKKIIGFGSSSLMDAIFLNKKFLFPVHCTNYNSYFVQCCPKNISTNFKDFVKKFKNLDKIKTSNFKDGQYDKILGYNKNNLFKNYEKTII